MIDLSTLTFAEAKQLLEAVSQRYQELALEQQESADTSRENVQNAIAKMEALLGASDGPPSTDSIRGVLRYSDADMAGNAGLAFRLAFIGLEELTNAVIDAAKILARS